MEENILNIKIELLFNQTNPQNQMNFISDENKSLINPSGFISDFDFGEDPSYMIKDESLYFE